MDIQRTGQAQKKRVRRAILGTAILVVVLLVTLGLNRLEPAAPTVERETVWVDKVKRGSMLRQVRGPGHPGARGHPLGRRLRRGAGRAHPRPARRHRHRRHRPARADQPRPRAGAADAESQLKAAQADYLDLQAQLESALLNQQAVGRGGRVALPAGQAPGRGRRGARQGGAGPRDHLQAVPPARRAARRARPRSRSSGCRRPAAPTRPSSRRSARGSSRTARSTSCGAASSTPCVCAPASPACSRSCPCRSASRSPPAPTWRAWRGRRSSRPSCGSPRPRPRTCWSASAPRSTPGTASSRAAWCASPPRSRTARSSSTSRSTGALPKGARPDLSVDGTIEIEQLDNVLYVGRPAYGQANSKVELFKLTDEGKQAVRVPVQLGRSSVNTIEIVSGLNAGDQVILSDTSAQDGHDKIRLN